ncbi:hypothetical protein, partial [Trueperella pyogenes]|uniref:hypothetical protein n=1 Tax=Trueperella pyogenes TaxID=1661 RepID=UPI003F536385
MRALCAVVGWWLVAEFAVHDRLHGVVEVAEAVAAFRPVAVLATDHGVRHGLQVRARSWSRGGSLAELGVDPSLHSVVEVSDAGLAI